jgi:hypothetical protein
VRNSFPLHGSPVAVNIRRGFPMLAIDKLRLCTSRTPHLSLISATCCLSPCPGLSPGRTTMATPSPWLSRATGDPKFRHRRTYQRKGGFPFMIFRDLTGHRPHPGSYDGNRSIHRRARRRSQTFYRRAKLYTSRSLGFKQFSFHHMARVLRNLTVQRLWMFFGCNDILRFLLPFGIG